jgi:6-phosphogluconolactonase
MAYCVYIAIAGEDRIVIWAMDPRRRKLEFRRDVAVEGGPSPLALYQGSNGWFLFAGLRVSCEIASFAVDRRTGNLSLLGRIPLDSDPCYLSTDRTGRYLFAAYYGAGKITVHRICEDGTVRIQPVETIATVAKAHSIQTDRNNRVAFVPHVGESNVIMQFAFDPQSGRLTPNPETNVHPKAGTGPRHYCFHPHLDIVYFVNEQGCSVSAYDLDPATGGLTHMETISTLPHGFYGDNTCAQIHITPSGHALYAANRGHDSIACFTIAPQTGRLSAAGHQPTERTPRAFAVSPDGEHLLVTGRASGRMATYQIDSQTGTLEPIDVCPVGERPMWVLPVELAE